MEIFPTPTLLQENNSLSLIWLKACLLANYNVTQSCRTHFSLSNQYFEFQHNAVTSVSTRDFNSFQWTYFIISYGKGWVLSELLSICRVTVKYIFFANVPINIKPERWGGGGGSGNPWEFDCDVYPQCGDFDWTSCIWSLNFKSSRREVNHLFLIILTSIFCPGVEILPLFSKMSKSPPPPLRMLFNIKINKNTLITNSLLAICTTVGLC